MITPSKLTFFFTLYLVVFALVPGMTAEFLLVPERTLPETLAACVLFLTGFLIGARLASYELYPGAGNRQWSAPNGRVSGLGLCILGASLLIMTAYIILVGPKPPVFAAAGGSDLLEAALLREEALKLNTDTAFVKAYAYTRDILGPAAFVLAIAAFKYARLPLRLFCVLLLCAALFISVWSGQKATLLNYFVVATIFLTRSTGSLARLLFVGAPAFAVTIFIMFLVTYPDTFAGSNADEVIADVIEGVMHRLFVSPFEVSMAYIDAINYQSFINWLDTIPVFGAMLRPGVPPVENVIGTYYFYSGIDSISANGLCFAYTYIQGGLPFCFAVGTLTAVVPILAIKFVRAGGNDFISKAFQAILMYKILDLLNGNPLSYLVGMIEIAILAWVLARVCAGSSLLRLPVRAKLAS
ncbi:MAG: hypothetical protein SGJ19_16245 [Planctomycetia bacterium]|nr:hypothetical protein [Planctomycetia bacterium]